jgi:hypothetical protein
MPVADPAKLAAAILTATQRTGIRFVVSSLSPDLRRLLAEATANAQAQAQAPAPAGQVLVIRQAPHDWLFPRTAAVVHHDGAGTTGAAVVARAVHDRLISDLAAELAQRTPTRCASSSASSARARWPTHTRCTPSSVT